LIVWLAVAVAISALAGLGALYRRLVAQERTIRRQIAREASLKARLDDVFDRTADIIVVHDRRGRIATMNRTCEQASGYSREEARMVDPEWLFSPVYIADIERMIAEGANATPRTIRAELIAKKGARTPIEAQARLLVADGQVSGVTVVARNVAEREQLEGQVRQAQKMEAVGRLATGIAHDFNNLLTVLMGYSDELVEGVEASSPLRKPVEEVRRAVERAAGLTQQLLAFSRRQTIATERIDVNITVANMQGLLRRLLGPEVRLELSLGRDVSAIEADPAQIGQIVMNLAVNARDAMPAGGQLTIRTANVDLGAEHLDVIPGPHVMIEVRDTGAGMTPDVQWRLFEPFFTTKPAGEGTGLGLSMVSAIVRQHGGHVSVSSEPGKGSTFHVYFPRVEGTGIGASSPGRAAIVTDETGADASPIDGATGDAGVVLLAEDDRAVRRLMTTELRRHGFVVLEARDGAEALQICTEYGHPIDVLVTDIVMPTMNGMDLAQRATPMRPDMDVVFMTGHPERAGVGVDMPDAGQVLLKPFTPDVLVECVQQTLERRRTPPRV
jgi:two-component system, cell cycle sensor histidine kinase and response regulator CckA